MSTVNNRVLGLDILRFFAIYLVLLAHAGFNPFPGVLLGSFGVELFFVLSSFLIGGILLREFEEYKGIATIKKFWINRWFRTLPLYYLALFIQIVLSSDIKWQYLYYLVFLQNNFFGIDLFPVSWSLVVEEWFYLTLPFVFIAIYKFGKRVHIVNMLYVFVLLLIFKLFYIYMRETHLGGVNGNILLRADTMLIGVMIAWIKRYRIDFYKKMSSVLVFLVGLSSIVIIQHVFFQKMGFKLVTQSTLIKTIYFPAQSIAIALLIPFLDLSDFINKKLNSLGILRNFIVWSSILSYSFYLFHMNVFHFVESYYNGVGSCILKLALLYLVSYLLYRLYEKPLTDLRERFR